jgi:hypothetical protein
MKNRPLPLGLRFPFESAARVLAFFLVAGALGACANPNFIGVQDYGYIVGNVVDQNNKPVAGALISATGTTETSRTDQNGNFNIQKVAIGEQTVSIQAAGYSSGTATVIIVKDQGVTAPTIKLTANQPGT